jgi:Flp pilus assembly protein protease CpaA
MNAIDLIGAALLIVLLLPAVVAEWERFRLPDIFHAALAVGGLAIAGATGGGAAILVALLVGLITLLLLSAAAALARSTWGFRPMTGGNIKLLAAASIWLGAGGTIVLVLAVAALTVLIAMLLRARNGQTVRPGFSPLAAGVTLSIFLSQGLTHAVA